jgi:polyisoprenoid-binding protein YceI
MSEIRTTSPARLAPGLWTIDPDHSNVEFVARHLFSRVRGRFTDVTGVITVDPDPARCSVEVTIRAASIDTNHEERDAHLRSPDFLDADRFPVISFTSTEVGPLDASDSFRVDGDLTIRDVTRPVVLAADYLGWAPDPWGGSRAGFSARTEIDRDEFGARWNVVLESGGLLVGRTVQIELEIEAIAAA